MREPPRFDAWCFAMCVLLVFAAAVSNAYGVIDASARAVILQRAWLRHADDVAAVACAARAGEVECEVVTSTGRQVTLRCADDNAWECSPVTKGTEVR